MTGRPRCTAKGCFVVYRGGPDRPCPLHTDDPDDSVGGRMSAYTEAMSAPGEQTADSDGDQDSDGSPPDDDEPITLGAYLAQRPSNHP